MVWEAKHAVRNTDGEIDTVKGKVVPVLPLTEHHAMKAYGEVEEIDTTPL
jgi:hypothetical protein